MNSFESKMSDIQNLLVGLKDASETIMKVLDEFQDAYEYDMARKKIIHQKKAIDGLCEDCDE